MSYGQNQPQGLQATKTLNSATYNGATSPYLIQSGYAQNIFQGDYVVFDYTSGYITAIIPLTSSATVSSNARIGVFAGCSYQTTTATNPIDPASPGRPYWPGGTVTLGSLPAIAMIIDDPMVVYNIQTNATPGLTQANMGSTFDVVWPTLPAVAPFLIPGNTSTGQSSMALNQSTAGASATADLRARNLVAIPGNVSGLGYNNAEVITQNHLYCSRPAS
jgi:hypothetical protein